MNDQSRRVRIARPLRALAALLIVALAGTGAMAQMPAAPGGGIGMELDLKASRLVLVVKDGEFSDLQANGNVELLYKEIKLFCDKLIYDPLVQKMYANVTTRPKVRVNSDEFKASAKSVTFHQKTSIFDLSGGAEIIQGEDRIAGDEITFTAAGEGKMRLTSHSAKSVQRKRAPPVDPELLEMMQKFGITEPEAWGLRYGGEKPTTMTKNPNQAKTSSNDQGTGPPSGRIGSDTTAIPKKSLDIEE